MAENKNRELMLKWQNNKVVLYDDYRMQVICADYEFGNDIGVFWKDTDDGNTAYPLSFNTVAPIRLNRKLSLIFLKGLKVEADENVVKNIKKINELIEIYEDKNRNE